ncbi:MAG: cytochrome c oxidase subunit 3, partial [Mycolicibacterium sp.]|uniref:cytochrome c oxidase subunit 3 n=1 Tax=Mycolicibacterium sp. TaxID=2320850 RepID=UPI003D0E9A70
NWANIPGEPALWVFLLGDMALFSMMFGVIGFYRSHDFETFVISQALLSEAHGVLNTVLLLTGSLVVALGVQAARRGSDRWARHYLLLGLSTGVGFCVAKWFEYSAKIDAGISPTTNSFFTNYFVFTGLHLVHVVIGIGVLALMWSRARTRGRLRDSMRFIEGGACYWHLVDLLWIVLFAFLYLA